MPTQPTVPGAPKKTSDQGMVSVALQSIRTIADELEATEGFPQNQARLLRAAADVLAEARWAPLTPAGAEGLAREVAR